MDFISSISFPNEPLISWTFLGHFCYHFTFGWVQQQTEANPPKRDDKKGQEIFEKCSTDHSEKKYYLWNPYFKALNFAEHYQERSKSLALENDWLHSLTNTPALSPAKQTVRTPMNLDEISEKLKKIGSQKR